MGTRRIRARAVLAGAVLGASLLTAGCGGTYAGGAAYSGGSGPDDPDQAAVESVDGQVDAAYFWNDLAPYGRWVNEAPYGWCWVPDGTSPDWRPYGNGRWVYTDAGFCWASDDPCSWATEHYGRWAYDSLYGWVWVPGSVWAPAWVAWHCDDDWVGWAPLPPTATWDVSVGLVFTDVDRIPAEQWSFVHRDHLCDAALRIRPAVMNGRLLARTKNVTRIVVRNGRPANDALDVKYVEHGGRVKVPRVTVVDVKSVKQAQGGLDHGKLAVFRPALREDAFRAEPPPAVRDRASLMPADAVRKQYDRQRKALEQSLARQRADLQSEHKQEARAAAPGSADEVRRRQEAEQQAFESRAAEQRRQLEEKQKQALAKAPAAQKAAPKAKRAPSDDERRSADRGDHGDRGDRTGRGDRNERGR